MRRGGAEGSVKGVETKEGGERLQVGVAGVPPRKLGAETDERRRLRGRARWHRQTTETHIATDSRSHRIQLPHIPG